MRQSTRRRGEGGASALEVGLVAPIMFLMIFGIIQYGYLFWSLTTASATAREAARRLAVGCEVVDVTTLARQHLLHPAVDPASITITHAFTDKDGADVAAALRGGRVQVTVSFQSLDIGFPFVPVPAEGVVTQSAVDDIENVPDSPLVDCASVPGNH